MEDLSNNSLDAPTTEPIVEGKAEIPHPNEGTNLGRQAEDLIEQVSKNSGDDINELKARLGKQVLPLVEGAPEWFRQNP
jgi:hypothetical protein